MSSIKSWIVSFRLRTLPLALSCTGMGGVMAIGFRIFNWQIFVFTSLTAILLQVLSNLANDYGDAVKGTDNAERVGPQRALQSGEITLKAMRNAIIICASLALVSGCWLLYIAIPNGKEAGLFFTFLLVGLCCIAAAVMYTVGKKAYGYAGLGDLAVFIFFGLIGVDGTFCLYSHCITGWVILPAISLGFLSAGVLNINNMRDIKNDAASGKKTIVVRMGLEKAKRYHAFLIITAILCMMLFVMYFSDSLWHWLFLVMAPLLLMQLRNIMKTESEQMDKFLKQLSLTTLLMVICLAISVVIQPYV